MTCLCCSTSGTFSNGPASSSSVDSFSSVLANHVALSELWDEPSPPVTQFSKEERTQYISNGLGVLLGTLHDGWPRVPRDSFWGKWATTSSAVLMMNGTLDPATPISIQNGARTAFTGLHQTFVAIPRGSHGVLLNSPIVGDVPCGTSLVVAFLTNPTAPLDTSCVDRVAPLKFDHAASTTNFFGTADLWGD